MSAEMTPSFEDPGRSFELPGVIAAIEGGECGARRLLEQYFAACQTVEAAPGLKIGVCSAADLQCARDAHWLRDWLLDALPERELLTRRGPGGEIAYALCVGQGRVAGWVDPSARRIDLFVEPIDSPPIGVLQAILNPLLREVLAARKMLLMHSAAVVTPDGTGVLLSAPSMGGKTTTALAVARRGGRLLSDDLLAIDANADVPTAIGIPKPLNLREPTLRFFEELAVASASHATAGGRVALPPAAPYGASRIVDRHPIHVACFLELSDGSPRPRAMGVREALPALIDAHAFTQLQAAEAPNSHLILSLAAHIKVYSLETGSSPAALGEWLIDSAAALRG